MTLNFGHDSARQQYHDLVEAISNLTTDPTNVNFGQQAAISAWSLCDWDHPLITGVGKLLKYQEKVSADCRALDLLQDIGNAKKHRTIQHYTPTVQNSETKGGFSRGFSAGFQQTGLYVEDNNGQIYLKDGLLKEAQKYWDNQLADLGQ